MKLTIEQIDQLEKRQLTPEQIVFLKLRTTLTLQEIGDLVGVSRQWVARVLDDAMLKIESQRRYDIHT